MPRAHVQSRWSRALPLGALTAAVGLGAGLLITGVAGAMAGEFILWLLFFFSGVCGVAGYLFGVFLVEGGADLVAHLFRGGSVGTAFEYSDAQALAIRGQYTAALQVYRAATAEHPKDPEPWIRGARLLRDQLKDYDMAAEWFRHAAAIGGISTAHEFTVVQELVELYDGVLERPERAIPELARLASRHEGTRAGDWARRRLLELRVQTRHDITDPASLDP